MCALSLFEAVLMLVRRLGIGFDEWIQR
jgi:hypothetical protein